MILIMKMGLIKTRGLKINLPLMNNYKEGED